MKIDFAQQRQAARDYRRKCLDYGTAHNLKPDKFPVLAKKDNPAEWLEWRAYYRSHGLAASLELMSGEPRHRDKTVPALSPFDFDPAWQPSQADLIEEKPFEWPNAQARQRMTELWQRIRPMFEPPKPKEPAKPKSDAEILAELEAKANEPIGPPTPALLKSLGYEKQERPPPGADRMNENATKGEDR
jgi:hypothetical protein